MGGKGVRNEKKVCMVQVLFNANYRSGPSRNHTIYGTVNDISLLVPVQRSPLIDKKTENEIVFTFFLLVFLTERSFCHRHNPTHNIVHARTRYSIHVRVLQASHEQLLLFFLATLSFQTCKKKPISSPGYQPTRKDTFPAVSS